MAFAIDAYGNQTTGALKSSPPRTTGGQTLSFGTGVPTIGAGYTGPTPLTYGDSVPKKSFAQTIFGSFGNPSWFQIGEPVAGGNYLAPVSNTMPSEANPAQAQQLGKQSFDMASLLSLVGLGNTSGTEEAATPVKVTYQPQPQQQRDYLPLLIVGGVGLVLAVAYRAKK